MSMQAQPANGLTLVSLFAGGGGSSCGYKAAGYDIRLAVEWDKTAAATYRNNFPDTPMFEGDIVELTGSNALGLAQLAEGELDVLDGSPPYQGFSTAGKRNYTDPRNSLFREYVRLLAAFHPRVFVMENVSGLAKGKMKLAFAAITLALKAEGYRVSCRLLNAWWYGVPQDRLRLIWVGIRDDLGIAPSHPEPIQRRPVTVGQAIGVSAITEGQHSGIRNHAIHRDKFRPASRQSSTLRAKGKPMVIERHSPEVLAAYERNGRYVASFHSQRLRMEAASPSQIAVHRHWHPNEPRYLTVEEAKVLQGFPASFQVDNYRIVGNSVPPPMAQAVGAHVAQLLYTKCESATDEAIKVASGHYRNGKWDT